MMSERFKRRFRLKADGLPCGPLFPALHGRPRDANQRELLRRPPTAHRAILFNPIRRHLKIAHCRLALTALASTANWRPRIDPPPPSPVQDPSPKKRTGSSPTLKFRQSSLPRYTTREVQTRRLCAVCQTPPTGFGRIDYRTVANLHSLWSFSKMRVVARVSCHSQETHLLRLPGLPPAGPLLSSASNHKAQSTPDIGSSATADFLTSRYSLTL